MDEKELIYFVVGLIAGKIIVDMLFNNNKSTDLFIKSLDTNEGLILLNSFQFKNFISTPESLNFLNSLPDEVNEKIINAM